MPSFLASGVPEYPDVFIRVISQTLGWGRSCAASRSLSRRSGCRLFLAGLLDATHNCKKEPYDEGDGSHPSKVDHRLDARFNDERLPLSRGHRIIRMLH